MQGLPALTSPGIGVLLAPGTPLGRKGLEKGWSSSPDTPIRDAASESELVLHLSQPHRLWSRRHPRLHMPRAGARRGKALHSGGSARPGGPGHPGCRGRKASPAAGKVRRAGAPPLRPHGSQAGTVSGSGGGRGASGEGRRRARWLARARGRGALGRAEGGAGTGRWSCELTERSREQLERSWRKRRSRRGRRASGLEVPSSDRERRAGWGRVRGASEAAAAAWAPQRKEAGRRGR